MLLLHFYMLCSYAVLLAQSVLQCKDEQNEGVDWFVSYKLPQLKTSHNLQIQKGQGYVFITSKSVSQEWKFSEKSVNDTHSIFGNTLQVLYTKQRTDDIFWLLYNDETPNKTVTFELGHTKGVIIGDKDGGIWLVHSVPRFPPVPSASYSYPKSGLRYGQSFLCITLSSNQLDLIGHQLLYSQPQVYSYYIPKSEDVIYSHLLAAASKKWIISPPWNHQQLLKSFDSVEFVSFAKSGKFSKDLYGDWVAQIVKSDMYVETWQNGRDPLPSECQYPYKVFNIKEIILKQASSQFSSHLDHSKWGMSTNSTTAWICIGDINRMKSQEERSGGTVCMRNLNVWKAFREAVGEFESCKSIYNKKKPLRDFNRSAGFKEIANDNVKYP